MYSERGFVGGGALWRPVHACMHGHLQMLNQNDFTPFFFFVDVCVWRAACAGAEQPWMGTVLRGQRPSATQRRLSHAPFAACAYGFRSAVH